MTSWKIYKLGGIADIQTGPFGSQLHNKDYALVGSPIVTVEHLGNRHFTTKNIPLVSDIDKARLSKYILSEGDIVFSRVGSVDRCSYVSDKEVGWLFSGRCLRVRCNREVYPLYIYYYFCLESVKQYIRNVAVGATMPSINTQIMSEIPISLPSLEEQRRIAGILGAIDDKIENNRRINTNLELQAQALYKQWFVDFDFPNEEGKPYKSSGGKMVDSELGPIPEEWRVGDIYKYVNVVYGAPYKSVLFNERKDGNPLIRIRDLKTFSPQYYTQEILPNTEFINTGDVVAGMDAEFVPCLWMGEKGVLNQRCCKFVGKQDSISNYYVMFLVKPELEFVQSYKTGTTVSHLGKADIDKFVVVQPPFAVIEKFSKIADALLNNKIKLAKENITLATLRDTLLPKLMNGEIITK